MDVYHSSTNRRTDRYLSYTVPVTACHTIYLNQASRACFKAARDGARTGGAKNTRQAVLKSAKMPLPQTVLCDHWGPPKAYLAAPEISLLTTSSPEATTPMLASGAVPAAPSLGAKRGRPLPRLGG